MKFMNGPITLVMAGILVSILPRHVVAFPAQVVDPPHLLRRQFDLLVIKVGRQRLLGSAKTKNNPVS